MKTIAKKSLSVVLAMIMVFSTLTVGGLSAFAAQLTDYSPVGEGTTNVVKTTCSFTPAASGYYNIMLATVKDGKSASSSFTVTTKDKFGNTENTVVSESAYSYTTAYANPDATKTGCLYDTNYAPAQATVKLAAGDTYYIDLSDSAMGNGVASSFAIVKTDFEYGYTTVSSEITYIDDFKYNEATDRYDIPVYTTEERTTGVAVAVTGYCGTSTAVTIPSFINGMAVTSVDLSNTASALARRITSVAISEGVKDIEYGAFSGFYALSSVNLPVSLETIGSYAFNNTALSGRITIPANVESIGYRAFFDTDIASVELTSVDTAVSSEAFGYKYVLNEATADPTDTTVGKTDGFFVIAPGGSLAALYAANNGFTAYDRANCNAGNHPYVVTKVAATLFSKGSTTSVCPVCGATTKKTSAKKTFKIKYLKSTKKNAIGIKVSKQSGITGYQIQYSTSKKFTKKTTKTVTVKTTKALSKTIKGLKGGKRYYVRVRAYKKANGKTYVSKYTATKSVKVKK